MPSKVFHREAVARPYAAVSFRLCLAALELQRPAQKNAPCHFHGVLLVCETAGAELPDLVGIIAFRIVLPAVFSADFQRHILHCCCRHEARAFPHVPAGRCYRGELCGKVSFCPCADSIFLHYRFASKFNSSFQNYSADLLLVMEKTSFLPSE